MTRTKGIQAEKRQKILALREGDLLCGKLSFGRTLDWRRFLADLETIWVFYAYGSSDAPIDISDVTSGDGRQVAIEHGVESAVSAYLSGVPVEDIVA